MRGSRDDALAAFLRAHRDEIMAIWERRVRGLAKARRLPRPMLVNHVPDMLERAAAFVEARVGREDVAERAERHGNDRQREGFDVREALVEVAMLRDATLEIRGAASVLTGDQAILIVQAFDPIIAGVMSQYA